MVLFGRVRSLFVVLAVVFVLSFFLNFGSSIPHARAEEPASVSSSLPSSLAVGEPFSMGASMFRMVGGLLFCLGLFGGGVHLYRRYATPGAAGTTRRLRIVEKLSVTQKSSLLLVSLDGRELLLSTGPDNLRLVSDPAATKSSFFNGSLEDACAIGPDDLAPEGMSC